MGPNSDRKPKPLKKRKIKRGKRFKVRDAFGLKTNMAKTSPIRIFRDHKRFASVSHDQKPPLSNIRIAPQVNNLSTTNKMAYLYKQPLKQQSQSVKRKSPASNLQS